MFKSATLKLTLWYVISATCFSLVFSAALYHFATNELKEGLNNQYHELVLNTNHLSHNLELSKDQYDTRSGNLLLQLIYFNCFVIAGASITSYLLAKRTLRPIAQAHQAQERFTAEASHELRTPLAAMRAGTEVALMTDSFRLSALRKALKENLVDIEKIQKLADHLLGISKYEADSRQVHQMVDLQIVLNQTIEQFKKALIKKHLKVIAKTAPIQVNGDAYGLAQLFNIVLDNAIKYSPSKSTITVTLKRIGDYGLISVKDEGVGIPKEDLPHVFERFYRSEKSVNGQNKSDGYGLGLSLAQAICGHHKGLIELQSQENHGTEVVIKLPIIK